ncbi:MAG TPA: hypothetical protein VHR15_18035 [Ktedonobacterales bacterium]|jgi:hypothetical protein|nr:hypothetical protein [Ktedonobacterales bacterium]
MTTDEALVFLYREYVEQSGFMARLRDEGTLDRAAIDDTLAAIEALRMAWGDATCLPLEHVWLLRYTDETLTPFCALHPEQRFEIFDTQYEILERVEEAITSAGWPKLDEKIEAALEDVDYWDKWRVEAAVPDRLLAIDEALLALRHHISRGYSLVVALRSQAAAFDKQAMETTGDLLRKSLDTMCPIWRQDGCVPRDTAYGLASLRSWLLNADGFYMQHPPVHERLLALTDDLTARVRRRLEPSRHDL